MPDPLKPTDKPSFDITSLERDPPSDYAEKMQERAQTEQRQRTDDLNEIVAKRSREMAQIQDGQNRQLDDRIRRIAREEIEKWAKSLVWENRPDSKSGG